MSSLYAKRDTHLIPGDHPRQVDALNFSALLERFREAPL